MEKKYLLSYKGDLCEIDSKIELYTEGGVIGKLQGICAQLFDGTSNLGLQDKIALAQGLNMTSLISLLKVAEVLGWRIYVFDEGTFKELKSVRPTVAEEPVEIADERETIQT